MTVPIADPALGERERAAVADVLESGMLADGPAVRAFEERFAEYCGTDHAVATSNGTTALHAMLAACDIGPGDRVLTTPFSFVATANAVRLVGAEPVFADIDPETYNLDPEAARAVAVEADVDAILVVHLYGLPADMDAFRSLAEELEVPLLEDACQAHGAEYDGERVGSIGDAGVFSFYPTKNMTTGEGGMVTTDSDAVAERLRRFVNHGRSDGDHVSLGHNFRLTSIGGALGAAQLERLPAMTKQRRRNAQRLTDGIKSRGLEAVLEPPREPATSTHVYHQYTVRTDHREAVTAALEDADVGYGIYYPTPIHEEPAYENYDGSVPEAERAAEAVLSLPVHPGVSGADLTAVLDALEAGTEVLVDA